MIIRCMSRREHNKDLHGYLHKKFTLHHHSKISADRTFGYDEEAWGLTRLIISAILVLKI